MAKVLTESEVAAIGGTSTSYGNRCCTKARAEELGCVVTEPSGAVNNQLITGVTAALLYVDLGLPSGTLWATMNVGASSETDYGNYYMYGKGSKVYDSTDTIYKGTEDPLAASADTATQVCGGSWHMPTRAQMQELTANTTYEWTTINGVNGGKFTATNGNYVFFPAAGFWDYGSQDGVGFNGCYWGSSPYGSNNACYLYFLYGRKGVSNDIRKYGYSVRPVVG